MDQYKILTDFFVNNFASFQSIKAPGGSAEANEIVAAGLAKSIIDAVHVITPVGELTCAEINTRTNSYGDLIVVADNGSVVGSETLNVNRGDVIYFNGEKFVKVFGGSSVAPSDSMPQMDGEGSAGTSAEYSRGDHVHPHDDGKADKVSGAVDGNFAALDESGNVQDSGKKASDFIERGVKFFKINGNLPTNIGSSTFNEMLALITEGKTIPALIDRSNTILFPSEYHDYFIDFETIYTKTDTSNEDQYIYMIRVNSDGNCVGKEIYINDFATSTDINSAVSTHNSSSSAHSDIRSAVDGKAPTNHASTATTYGVGDTTHYGHVKVDSSLSSTSTNPVQNKVVKAALDGKLANTDLKYTCGENIVYQLFSKGSYNTSSTDGGKSITISPNNTDTYFIIKYADAVSAGEMLSVSLDVEYEGEDDGNWSWSFAVPNQNSGIVFNLTGSGHYTTYGVSPISVQIDSIGFFDDLRRYILPINSFKIKNLKVERGAVASGFCLCPAEQRAATLTTPRTIQTNLGSTDAAAFDGSANVNPGVTGTLPITHGGTGATTAANARANLDVYSKSEVSQSITNEATDRQQADGELQAQIDAISSKSDVVDVVASYVELVAYDTSTLGDNDVIKVLEDETHDDAESYYRWNLTTETWGYVGSQGPFVTPAEMQTALGGKQNVNGSNATSAGMSTALNKLDVGSEDFLDTDYIICSGHNSGSTYTSEFVRRTFTKLYNRIKAKLDSVYASLQDLSGKADNTPTFSQAATRANLAGSGETMPTILGKIKKFFSDLKTVAFTGSYSDLTDKPTIDSALSGTSTNAVQNKVVKDALDGKVNAGYYSDPDTGHVALYDEYKRVLFSEFSIIRATLIDQEYYSMRAHPSTYPAAIYLGAYQFDSARGFSVKSNDEYLGVAAMIAPSSWDVAKDYNNHANIYAIKPPQYSGHMPTLVQVQPATASTTTPLMDGVAYAGSETAYARGNHRHPTDTSRQAALPTSGTASFTYAINISGNANTANNASGKNFIVNGKGQEASVTVRYNDSTPPILLDATENKRGLWASVSGSYAGKWVLEVDSTNEVTLHASKIKCSSVSAVFGAEKNLDNMVCNEGEIVNVYESGESASSGYSNRPVSSTSSFRLEISSTRASSSIFNFKQIFFNGKDGRVYSRYTTGTTLSAAKSNWSAWTAGI